jgi:Ca-activated chloride channel family protein
VEFDDTVRRLWPATPRGDGAAQMAAIDAIECGGSTDLHAGWQNGGQALADVAGQGLKRVILLSDGGANQGETDPTTIAAGLCAHGGAGHLNQHLRPG